MNITQERILDRRGMAKADASDLRRIVSELGLTYFGKKVTVRVPRQNAYGDYFEPVASVDRLTDDQVKRIKEIRPRCFIQHVGRFSHIVA